jgi:hypothetical protein
MRVEEELILARHYISLISLYRIENKILTLNFLLELEPREWYK